MGKEMEGRMKRRERGRAGKGEKGEGKAREGGMEREERRRKGMKRKHMGRGRENGRERECSRSRQRAANGSKRMYLDYTHGLFIT